MVTYCALDREFSEPILATFEELTEIDVLPKFDTEANKAVGLFQNLVREASRPRCDVHWNNEILATIRLQKKGVLQPYHSPAAKPYPEQFKAADGSWHAFASRARILIVNTKLVADADMPTSIFDVAAPRFRDTAAMAKPQFGTTATHAACLFEAWGAAKAEQFYRDLKTNKIHIVPGNKQVAEGVGQGRFAVGFTDTDDAMAEVRAGRPVRIIFPDQDNGGPHSFGTLFIPNTVALIRNAPHPEEGKKLIDYLLSEDVESRLAKTAGCQIPLNPNVKVQLPAAMREATRAKRMKVDFHKAADRWQESQRFLANLFGS